MKPLSDMMRTQHRAIHQYKFATTVRCASPSKVLIYGILRYKAKEQALNTKHMTELKSAMNTRQPSSTNSSVASNTPSINNIIQSHSAPAGSSALVRHETLPISNFFHSLTRHFNNVFCATMNRMPGLKPIVWSLISPLYSFGSAAVQADNPPQQETLLNKITRSESTQRINLINSAISETNKDEFDESFDWLSNRFLVREKGDSILTIRTYKLTQPNEHGREDSARLLQNGVSLEAIAYRHELPLPAMPPELAHLLTPKVLATMMATCPLSNSANADPKEAPEKIIALIATLAEHLALRDSPLPQPGLKAFNDLIAQHRKALTVLNRTDNQGKKHLAVLKSFQTAYANLLWSKHYSAPKEIPESVSPRSVMFFSAHTTAPKD